MTRSLPKIHEANAFESWSKHLQDIRPQDSLLQVLEGLLLHQDAGRGIIRRVQPREEEELTQQPGVEPNRPGIEHEQVTPAPYATRGGLFKEWLRWVSADDERLKLEAAWRRREGMAISFVRGFEYLVRAYDRVVHWLQCDAVSDSRSFQGSAGEKAGKRFFVPRDGYKQAPPGEDDQQNRFDDGAPYPVFTDSRWSHLVKFGRPRAKSILEECVDLVVAVDEEQETVTKVFDSPHDQDEAVVGEVVLADVGIARTVGQEEQPEGSLDPTRAPAVGRQGQEASSGGFPTEQMSRQGGGGEGKPRKGGPVQERVVLPTITSTGDVIEAPARERPSSSLLVFDEHEPAQVPAVAGPRGPSPGVRSEHEEQHQQAQLRARRQPEEQGEQLPDEQLQHQHHDRRRKEEENKRLDIFERLIANFPDFLAQVFAASSNSVVTNRAHTTPAADPHQQRPTEDLVQSREKKRLVDAHLRSSAFLAGDPLTGAPLFENFAFLLEDATGVVEGLRRDLAAEQAQERERIPGGSSDDRTPGRSSGAALGDLTSGGAPSAITISEELQVVDEVEDGDMRAELPDPGAESRGTTPAASQISPPRGLTQAEKKVKRARRHFLAVREIFVRVLGYYAQVAGEKWQIVTHMKVPTKDDVMERKRSLAGSFQLADLVKNTDEHLGVTAVQVAQEASNTPVASAPGGTEPSEPSTRGTLQDMLIVRPESMFKHDKITLLPDNEETFWEDEIGSKTKEEIDLMFNTLV
ncbi:unnamed protein product [Amoebophrya sp. A25]|nr:unnamed protein product [Amoebophrya sp. A25]|eukprot:GSA25T00003788001.1